MPRTPARVRGIAYGMEQFLVLFLIFTLNEDPALRERLKNFLSFYRENRELLAVMTKNEAPMSEGAPSETKNSSAAPFGENGAKILEDLLSRLG